MSRLNRCWNAMSITKKYAGVAANKWLIISLLAGIFVSIAASVAVARFNHNQANDAVMLASEHAADAVVSRLNLYQYGLRGVRGSILSMPENTFTRTGFDRYGLSRNVDQEFPGARSFGFVRRVAPKDEVAFLAQARADGWPDFSIHQFAQHDSDRYVIQYISPLERNRVAIGLDIGSEPHRRQAALSSMRSGEVRLTAPITLVGGTGTAQQSFLILLPIYSGVVTPDTVKERERKVFGWAYAALSMEEVLAGLRPPEDDTLLELRDVTDPASSVVIYNSDDTPPPEAVLSHRVERDVFGRRWQVQLSVYPRFLNQLRPLSPWLVLGAGGLVTLLLVSLVGVLGVSRTRQRQIIAEQATLASIVESSADGIIGNSLDGSVTSWNKGAEKLLGFSAQEALGRSFVDLVVPASLRAQEAEIIAHLHDGKPVPSFNTQRTHKNGELISVSVTVAAIRDSSDHVIGASITVRDISEQMAAEARINELNSSLEAQVAERTSELRQLNVLLGNVLRSASEVAIIATDHHGVIRLFNTGAERMLGYAAADVIDRSTPAAFHLAEEVAARSNELSTEFSQPIEGFRVFVHKAELEGAETREWTYVRSDGTPVPVSLSVTAMRDEQGAFNGYLGMAVDLTARKAFESAFTSARDQLLMAADVAELGIWSLSLADNKLSWNDRMFELYGQPLSLRGEGLSYEHWYSRVHPDDAQMAEDALRFTLEEGGIYDPIFRVVRPDGEVRIVHAGAQVERDVSGVALRVTGINRDITVQRELESRLRDARDQADAASAAKSSFLANMSHEIRTPMNAVLGMLHLVQNTEMSLRHLDYISKAESAAKSLLGLLNDILDYSKIEADKLQLDVHAFELEALMRDLAVVLAGNQGAKDVEVMFDLAPTLPSSLLGDSMRLQQVLINLAGNALKFTQHGQVVVKVEELQRTDEVVRLHIEVSDSGIGISESQLQRIFDGFTQAEASTTRRFGGTGLGLAISKRLIALMGGQLQVSSEKGVGSRFWFDIDMGISQALPLTALRPGVDRSMRLLVADDNEVAGDLLVRAVEALGWQADLVTGGHQAVARAQHMQDEGRAYDVILMDWRMPDLDGLSTARLIRTRSHEQSVPMIIMVTAYGREVLADAQQEGEVPFSGFLIKPITPKQLADTINQVLAGDKVLGPTAASVRSAKPKRLAGMRLLVVEDNILNRQVAYELLQGEGAQVSLAEGGLEGVQLATESPQPFDAVLMDVQMPDIDGLEATRRIRAHVRSQAVTIIAMTANASSADETDCRAAGMNDHLGKPIDLDKMVNTLLRHAGRACAVPNAPQQTTNAPEPVVEPFDTISQRFGENLDLIRTVLGSFATEQARQLALLHEHATQANATAAASVLHAIKGSSGTMGARAMAKLAGDVEQRLLNEDEASTTGLLADSRIVETLGELLRVSDEALKAMFASSVQPTSSEATAPAYLPIEAWCEAMGDILRLLEASNMNAIAQSKTLLAKTPTRLRPLYDPFFERVQSLDFAGSLILGRALLDSV